jgi:hypothetical protein
VIKICTINIEAKQKKKKDVRGGGEGTESVERKILNRLQAFKKQTIPIDSIGIVCQRSGAPVIFGFAAIGLTG